MPLQYNKDLKLRARELRKDGTKGEAILWKRVLRAKKMRGHQFNRQFPMGNFIVDFIARKIKLIIEVDGSSHLSKGKQDSARQNLLEKSGYTVVRFKEEEVIYQIDQVAGQIYHVVKCLEEEAIGE